MSRSLTLLSKTTENVHHAVMPLERLWWVRDMAEVSMGDKSSWEWMAMIVQPDHITTDHVAAATHELRRKKDPPALDRIRHEPYREGLAVSIMGVGPYADEAPTIARLHQLATDSSCQLPGKHHEIYFSDPRRTAPEKLRTAIRPPAEARPDYSPAVR
jgi:hypothetical protein